MDEVAREMFITLGSVMAALDSVQNRGEVIKPAMIMSDFILICYMT